MTLLLASAFWQVEFSDVADSNQLFDVFRFFSSRVHRTRKSMTAIRQGASAALRTASLAARAR